LTSVEAVAALLMLGAAASSEPQLFVAPAPDSEAGAMMFGGDFVENGDAEPPVYGELPPNAGRCCAAAALTSCAAAVATASTSGWRARRS
jgi:hypothetical protein